MSNVVARRAGQLALAPKATLLSLAAMLPLLAVTPSMRIYSTTDGLVQNDVNRIKSDSRGFLWFATAEGLSRFDGLSFRNYGTQDGLADRDVTDIAETNDGLWVATQVGISRFNPEAAAQHTPLFTNYRLNAGEDVPRILKLLADTDGHSLWCGTAKGLFRFAASRSRSERVPLRPSGREPQIFDIFRDGTGALWLATDEGLVRRSAGGQAKWFGVKDGLPPATILCLAADAEGRLWAGTDRGLYLLNSDPDARGSIVVRVYNVHDGLSSNLINDLLLRKNGVFSVATGRGYHFFTRQPGVSKPVFSGYRDPNRILRPSALGEDSAGNLWLATFRGVVRLNGHESFLTFDKADGLSGGVKSIFEDRAGEICAVSNQKDHDVLSCMSKGAFAPIVPGKTRPPASSDWGWNQIHMQDHLGEWWIPRAHRLYRYAKVSQAAGLAAVAPKAVYGKADGLPDSEVFRIFEDSRGDIWISYCHEDALAHWHRATGAFERIRNVAGLPTSFAEDRAGNIWIGFYWHNLLRYRDGRLLWLTPANGFPDGSVFGLYVDHAGRLWAGTTRGGLVRIDAPAAPEVRYRAYTSRQGFSSDQVIAVTEDQWGSIYAITGRGIDRLNPDTGDVRHFDVPAGNAAFRDRKGRLWFGGRDGLLMLEASPEPAAGLPDARIASLRVRGRPWPISEFGVTAVAGIELSAANNQLQFDFFAPNFDPARKIVCQYKLEGIDQEWSPPATVLTANYASVPPGSYRYQVRTIDTLGRNGRPAVVAFRILPPFWQRWWFLTGMAGLTACLVAAAYNYRVNRLFEMARIRQRIATDLHDDIGSSLSQIALLSEVARRENGPGEALSRIGSVSRELIDSMSDVVWAIDPRWDGVGDLFSRMRRFAGDLLAPSGLELHFEAKCCDDNLKLDPDTRRNIFLILKEALHNAVKHAHGNSVSISVACDSRFIILVVEDDGKGFELLASAEKGHGLRSMRGRAAALHAELEIRSGKTGGTYLAVRAPLNRTVARRNL